MQIYFATVGSRIKVGVSNNPLVRLRQLSRDAGGEPVTLIGSIKGGVKIEKAIHKAMALYRIKGEFYHDCPETRATIQNYFNNFDGAFVERIRKESPFGLACKAVWPHKTAEKLAAASGQSVRACAYEIAGEREPSGRSAAALIAAALRWPL